MAQEALQVIFKGTLTQKCPDINGERETEL